MYEELEETNEEDEEAPEYMGWLYLRYPDFKKPYTIVAGGKENDEEEVHDHTLCGGPCDWTRETPSASSDQGSDDERFVGFSKRPLADSDDSEREGNNRHRELQAMFPIDGISA